LKRFLREFVIVRTYALAKKALDGTRGLVIPDSGRSGSGRVPEGAPETGRGGPASSWEREG
jgi:hypothetical protein